VPIVDHIIAQFVRTNTKSTSYVVTAFQSQWRNDSRVYGDSGLETLFAVPTIEHTL
jgi:hypothetical protein